MTFFDAIILGIVEGVTEFLPISSTGHLILVSEVLRIPHSAFLSSFEIAIQLGAILAVLLLYWRSFLDLEVIKRVIAAFIPTACIGFALYPFVKGVLFGNPLIVVFALALGGAALIFFEMFHGEREGGAEQVRDISYSHAVLVGFFQALAIIPGVSRSAATIVGGLVAGIRRVTIVEFSFLLAVPTMLAATSFDLLKTSASFTPHEYALLATGFVVSGAVAFAAVRFLLAFIRTHSFISFGVYRIVVAALFFLVVL